MKIFSRTPKAKSVLLAGFCFVGLSWLATSIAQAQPIMDSLHAIEQRNEKMYRQLNAMDELGSSYHFTNVTAWKITDDDLRNQIITVYKSQFGEKQLKDFDIDEVYLFAAPVGNERFEPFHVLFRGRRIKTDTSGADLDPFFGGGRRRNTNELVPVAFRGKDVVRLMHRQPALLENINSIQGDIVELPGAILPSGVQLIKNSTERYVFHQMFEGFYSKRQIIDEQKRALGLPTSDEEFATADTTTSGTSSDNTTEQADPNQLITDPDQSSSLPDEAILRRAFRYEKMIDLSMDHLTVNAARNTGFEVQLGNPEVGLPFWTSGLGRFWVNLKNQIGTESNFKLGLVFPTNFLGKSDWALYNARKMTGSWGGSIEAYFAGIDFFSAFNLPVYLSATIVPAGGNVGDSSYIYAAPKTDRSQATYTVNNFPLTVNNNHVFYRTGLILQLAFPFTLQLDPANFLEISPGIGIQNVYASYLPTTADLRTPQFVNAGLTENKVVDLQRVSTPLTPHIQLSYVNHRSSKFGASILYDHLFTFSGWLELVEDHFRIEMSYTTPMLRDLKPYEPGNFFYITPRFYF